LGQTVNPSPNCIHGGEYVTVTGLIAGNIYRISTCGVINFDTQLSIYPEGGGTAVAYNDNWCGTQSEITFNPFVSGNYDVLIDRNDCQNDTGCANLAVQLIKIPAPVITIPVVIHIIHFGEAIGVGRNISEAQILSQIAVLNECYRRTNTDVNTTPAAFKGISDDARIEFCLATQDEFGNPTTGIERVMGTQASYNTYDDFDALEKPRTIWDRNKYLNIWTWNDGGIGAYATFPGDPDSLDGVVIPYYYFGRVGNVSQPFALGKTAVHEIGHWFNLNHIWGSNSGCTTDDGVTDTPKQGTSCPFGQCPAFPRLDACQTTYPGIMYYNQMDYSGDPCLTIFTVGQCTRMHASINASRMSILSSQGCAGAVGINESIIAKSIKIFPNPSDGICSIEMNDKLIDSDLLVTNVVGKVVLEKKISSKNTEINLSGFANGVYFVSVISRFGKFNQKLILDR
jgi:hypothetical protein